MKAILFVFSCLLSGLTIQAQFGRNNLPAPVDKTMIVEASCGECQFHLNGKGCDLAVRIDGKAYFVDGTTIDEHGDAHANDGFCNAIRKAEVRGKIVKNRFKATYFKLLDPDPKTGITDKKMN